MIFIVGLGNPGAQYLKTRHNIGFMSVDAIAKRHRLETFNKKYEGLYGFCTIKNIKFLLCQPQTFMNLSGRSVVSFLTFYKIHLDNLWVIHDDIDLEFGDIRIKKGGGSAGHNGLKSIDSLVGSNYNRIRIGVGRPLHKSQIVNYVLSPFNEEENKQLEELISRVVEIVENEVVR